MERIEDRGGGGGVLLSFLKQWEVDHIYRREGINRKESTYTLEALLICRKTTKHTFLE